MIRLLTTSMVILASSLTGGTTANSQTLANNEKESYEKVQLPTTATSPDATCTGYPAVHYSHPWWWFSSILECGNNCGDDQTTVYYLADYNDPNSWGQDCSSNGCVDTTGACPGSLTVQTPIIKQSGSRHPPLSGAPLALERARTPDSLGIPLASRRTSAQDPTPINYEYINEKVYWVESPRGAVFKALLYNIKVNNGDIISAGGFELDEDDTREIENAENNPLLTKDAIMVYRIKGVNDHIRARQQKGYIQLRNQYNGFPCLIHVTKNR
ncbi:hypothetical protein [Calycomorphotria hydatis]|uniref:Uncharacterized protein n=1 Tax=Calycomorphotria hydatis TaxID=2528027 RepID=A0A517TBX8_9PLAN|nr:hypothetical protein [Calycomorphotria hydatis]QDT65878.1 hypothetical protein V22_31400 [Calycomorphotria hydatis]